MGADRLYGGLCKGMREDVDGGPMVWAEGVWVEGMHSGQRLRARVVDDKACP